MPENGFLILYKSFLMYKTRIIGQKWLVNELVLAFYAIKKGAKAQSKPTIFSKVTVFTDDRPTDRQTPV